jgi:hypothetical protein
VPVVTTWTDLLEQADLVELVQQARRPAGSEVVMSAAASSAVIVLPGSRVVARVRKRWAADALSSRYEQAKAWSTPTPACCSPRAVKLVKNGTLKTYAGYPHGMPTTHADVINADLLTFIQS